GGGGAGGGGTGGRATGRRHGSAPAHHSGARSHRVSADPLAGRAVWIWELPNADQGDIPALIADAHRFGVSTLLVKSSDGTTPWPQFSPQLVAALHAGGVRVCAWQYVYGTHPVTEAYLGAAAAHDGADCLVIDAEGEYEGRYVQAQTYITRLRALIGARYPVALAGFPYVDFHPAFPYSVFLGPGGAQLNAPQMYWRAIGVSTDAVFAHTYAFNLPYARPILPLGQLYGRPPARQIVRFRELARVYGAAGVSWWDWQEARPAAWTAISRSAGGLPGYVPDTTMAPVGQGADGDLIVWAQEHLISAGDPIAVSGDFSSHTLLAVQAFQAAHGLPVDGIIGQETWTALLRYRPAAIRWVAVRHHGDRATIASAAPSAGRRGVIVAPVPRSASRPARRDEIAGAGGAGR
ncbi:MAG: peptidoglycan-binding domain-containing protein, partial [Solirubrobacteraceae bacterium]